MALTASTMLPLGTAAPDFALPDVVTGNRLARGFAGPKGLLVMFICRHCPFVKHVQDELAKIGRDYAGRGVGIVAISANDVAEHPEDAPAKPGRDGAGARTLLPIFVRRVAGGRARVSTRHARRTFSSSTSERQAGLSRPARRQPARQRDSGHRERPARGARRGDRGPPGRGRAAAEHRLQHQVEMNQSRSAFGAVPGPRRARPVRAVQARAGGLGAAALTPTGGRRQRPGTTSRAAAPLRRRLMSAERT